MKFGGLKDKVLNKIKNNTKDPEQAYRDISQLIKENKLQEALKECQKYDGYIPIVSKMISIYSKLGDKASALLWCNKYIYNPMILSQKIKILIKDGNLEEAIIACDSDPDNALLQSQKMNILLMQEKYDEALEICDLFMDNSSIQERRNVILEKKQKAEQQQEFKQETNKTEGKEEVIDIPISSKELTALLTRITYDDITLDEILSYEMNENYKQIFIIAYYEKNNKKMGIQYIKDLKKQSNLNDKNINILFERLNQKNVLFDASVYGKILNCGINSDLAIQILGTEKQEEIEVKKEEKPIRKEEVIKPKPKKQQPKMIVSEGKKVSSRSNGNISSSNSNSNIKTRTILIKDIFSEEILEMQKYLYVQMQHQESQSMAISLWDRLEILIDKPISDKAAINRMIDLLYKMQDNNFIKIDIDEEKVKKYL